jgi:large subunit ribosomal protein L17
MRHRVQGRKLGLPSDQRMALLKNLVRQLFEHGHIMTTETRAKEVRRIAERLITRGRQDTLHSRRMVRRVLATSTPNGQGRLSGEDYVRHLFDEIAPKFKDRPGGYTRIIHIGFRRGDAAPVVKLELATD